MPFPCWTGVFFHLSKYMKVNPKSLFIFSFILTNGGLSKCDVAKKSRLEGAISGFVKMTMSDVRAVFRWKLLEESWILNFMLENLCVQVEVPPGDFKILSNLTFAFCSLDMKMTFWNLSLFFKRLSSIRWSFLFQLELGIYCKYLL